MQDTLWQFYFVSQCLGVQNWDLSWHVNRETLTPQAMSYIRLWAIWNFKCWFPCLWSPLWGTQTTRSKPSLGTGWCALSWFNYLLLGTKRAKTRETRCAYSTTVQEVKDGRSIDWCKQVECMHARTRHAPATHGIDLFIFQLLPLSRWWATLSIITFVASDRCALKGHGIQTVHFQSGTITWKVWRLGLSRTLSPGEIHSVMGRLADSNIVICLPQVFNTPEQLVNEVYVTWIDRIEWKIRSQIPRLFCDTHWNQNDTVFGTTCAYVHAMFWEWTTWKHCTLAKCEHVSETSCSRNTHLLDIMNAFRSQIILSSLRKKQGCLWHLTHSSQPPLGGSQPLMQPMRAGHSCLTAALLGQCVSCHGVRQTVESPKIKATQSTKWSLKKKMIMEDFTMTFFANDPRKRRKYSLGFHCWVVLNRCPGLSLGRPTS